MQREKFKNVFLLTTSMQDRALQMYKMMGFELTKSEEIHEWWKTFYEERYDLRLS
ncbi:hypothetical protein [Flavobacterium anhuiense]|uniref:hypothetical protein n=1 Tax=Flavobacterium anhuiense TaxID=459526 RepID=UPI003D990B17